VLLPVISWQYHHTSSAPNQQSVGISWCLLTQISSYRTFNATCCQNIYVTHLTALLVLAIYYIYFAPSRGAKYCNKHVYVCLSHSHLKKPTCPNVTKFSVIVNCSHAVAWYSSDDNAIYYVFPVLWITSCLPIISQAKATPVGAGSTSTGAKRDVHNYLCFWVVMYAVH